MKTLRFIVGVLLCFAVLTASGQSKKKQRVPAPLKNDSALAMEIVTFRGAVDALAGYLYKPPGKGPFPGVIFVTEFKKPLAQSGPASQFDELARFWTANGYILFIPDREPQDFKSAPIPIGDEKTEAPINEDEIFMQNLNRMHKDLVAATEWLKAQAITDDERVVLTGSMLGAAQAIIAADKGLAVSAIVPFSPGAMSWSEHPMLQAALRRGIRTSKAPIYLIQTQNDKSLAPSALLGKELLNKGEPNRTKVYPPFGTSHNDARAFAIKGSDVWGKDVVIFLKEVLPLLANANGK